LVPSAPFQTHANGFFISSTTTFSSTRKAGHHRRRRRRHHHCARRGTRHLHAEEPRRREGWGREGVHRGTSHLLAAEAKKGMLLRGDPDVINNGFLIAARSLDVRSPCWCGRPSDSGGRHVKGGHVKDAAQD